MFARNDLAMAEAGLTARMESFEGVSFHAQQAAEKALKSLLVRHQIEFDRTHNLAALLQLAEPVAPGISEELAGAPWLTPFAVTSRYPGGASVSRDDAAGHLALGRAAVEAVERRLQGHLSMGDEHS